MGPNHCCYYKLIFEIASLLVLQQYCTPYTVSQLTDDVHSINPLNSNNRGKLISCSYIILIAKTWAILTSPPYRGVGRQRPLSSLNEPFNLPCNSPIWKFSEMLLMPILNPGVGVLIENEFLVIKGEFIHRFWRQNLLPSAFCSFILHNYFPLIACAILSLGNLLGESGKTMQKIGRYVCVYMYVWLNGGLSRLC